MMKKSLIILLVSFFFVTTTEAQRWKLKRYELIAGLGAANIFGDIGGANEQETWGGLKDIKIGETRPSFQLGARFRITEEQAVKLNIISGLGAADDKNTFLEYRGHSYSTFLIEPSIQYEYYILAEDRNMRSSAMFSKRGMVNTFSMISLYAFVGAGGVMYKPNFQHEFPLEVQTAEGGIIEEMDNSAGFSPVFPMGLGVKYVLTSEISLNFEMGRRFTNTDYIDGFHTNVSKANDIYYFSTLSVVYKLTTSRRGIPILFENRSKGRSSKGPRKGRKPIGF